ncbi:UDP-2,3-diacylglucosamine diphosphatase [Coxiella endosymbiont of Amblyomma nuttalli]|uniref:UDP-2,3-diacylglucosamine diphosphatase n=1 Tax=Coxiella endosymbiont of Amblyomma nuttalli TaxID=2749996 RepID=UPI001BB4CF3C|nr:UDP-2,3-diacylglucosamine diphosphatase [Coxiella endosymbiont of Amblyomma nuttalli]QTS83652.1 UDP-2,3-diacylglucosamine hydrolase [Coxiella endosymbiont of Amblyomma nuttalli]
MKSHTLFISDLHLEEEKPSITARFFDFMEYQAPKSDAIYILGDFFEAWIGDDNQSIFNRKIIEVLRKLTEKGPEIYFMRGNRDFLIGKKFAIAANIILLKDPTVISLYNKSILLMHGDSLCMLDHKHQIYRRNVAKPWVEKLMLSLPLVLRRKLAKELRKKSRNHNRYLSFEIQDVTHDAVKRVMQRHNVELLIHGHTHHPAIHDLIVDKKPVQRIVLGAWYENGSVLRYFSDGRFELHTFT